MKDVYLIWWLSQEDCTQIEQILPSFDLPKYIQAQFDSRVGRNGRGRLWIDKKINDAFVEAITVNSFDLNHPESIFPESMAQHAANCGGIVIDADDFLFVAGLSGFVTDLELRIFTGKYG